MTKDFIPQDGSPSANKDLEHLILSRFHSIIHLRVNVYCMGGGGGGGGGGGQNKLDIPLSKVRM